MLPNVLNKIKTPQLHSLESPDLFVQFLRCSNKSARKLLPFKFAKKYLCLPLAKHENPIEPFLSVMFASEPSSQILSELKFISGYPVVATIGEEDALRRAVSLLYAQDENQLDLGAGTDFSEMSKDVVAKFCKQLFVSAVSYRSSDIHIEYNHTSASIRLRLQGRLEQLEQFDIGVGDCRQLCRYLKVLSSLDTCAPNSVQEGAFELNISEMVVRIRISSIPISGGEKCVLRLMKNGFLEDVISKPFEEQLSLLGVFAEQQVYLRRFLRAERGALLVSGPTGSGKSTLLYSILTQLCCADANIVTIEDPVEALVDQACQIDLSLTKTSYEQMLVHVLRQDPDAILLGEIRSNNSAQTALQAAIAGAKVLSSVHAGSCFEVIARLLNLGVTHSLLGLSIHTISAQRLLPKNCQYCAYQDRAEQSTEVLFQIPRNQKLVSSKGCKNCKFAGRVAVYEFLVLDSSLKSILRECSGDYLGEFAKKAYSQGFRSYAYYVRELLLRGVIEQTHARGVLGV